MSKINLLLLFGGESAEHEVSIRSARNVYDALDKTKYDVSLCYIDRSGKWWQVDDIMDEVTTANQLSPALGDGALVDANGDRLSPDVILPILHGPNGEDGSVQGLAQLLHVPIVGCGIVGSAVCMDKDVAKRLLRLAGVSVVDYVLHRSGEPELKYDDVAAKLGKTLFVKPANMGSSVGVSRVTGADGFARAMAEAQKHDRKVLVERAIKGRELECAVLGNDHPEASVVGEILPGEEFYSYDAKYSDSSKTKTSTHAELPPETAERIRKTAVQAYTALECRGLTRVDFFLGEDGTTYVNELNTLPGFTNISMYPQLWKASGLEYSALLDRLVVLALQ
jgi:D-alanine-D-alanine ligase